jgi:hypothetical protein
MSRTITKVEEESGVTLTISFDDGKTGNIVDHFPTPSSFKDNGITTTNSVLERHGQSSLTSEEEAMITSWMDATQR